MDFPADAKNRFIDRENWHGSCYELGIDYSDMGDERIIAAMRTLWDISDVCGPLGGPYAMGDRALEMVSVPALLYEDKAATAYGLTRLDPGDYVGFSATITSLRWLVICVPMGMLEIFYNIDYPITTENDSWATPLRNRLMDIAQIIYQLAPFNLAVIGEEAAAFSPGQDELTSHDLDRGLYLVSDALLTKLRPSSNWEILPSGLHWRIED